MLEILEFILGDTTNFLGTIVLIFMTGYSISIVIDSIKGNNKKE